MHCLGAVAGGAPSPNGVGGRGGILSVFRALGVLVCEGRIQGPPRGYKEGPHCAPPMQAVPNDHVCEEDNYLCDRYLVLVREIADRISIGSFLCVEVLLCSDCPCGLAKSTCKHPICTVPSLSISPWQHTSEMLLEYWCICVIPSKSPETMNFQGLYQAVRSRLHFSQVAAWWSRSNGTAPSHVATRVVSYNEDNLRKFRESPVEHTFPLAGNGDGNSIKVTVWALPRMEDVPVLVCPIHPTKEVDEEGVARALTPTKTIPVPTAPQNPESLVLPALVDDRLQTPCDKPGKHHCRCEEEDASPPSPSIARPNGERKRRRSLPCGPPEPIVCLALHPAGLPSVQEAARPDPRAARNECKPRGQAYGSAPASEAVKARNSLNSDNLERCFKAQLNIEEREGNLEKRYKRTVDSPEVEERSGDLRREARRSAGRIEEEEAGEGKASERNGLFENLIPFNPSLPWSFVESWNNSAANSKCAFQSLRASREAQEADRGYRSAAPRDAPILVNPFRQPSPFHESNPGPSTHGGPHYRPPGDSPNAPCNVHQSCTRTSSRSVSAGQDALETAREEGRGRQGRDLTRLMSKMSLPEERPKEEGGFFDWFSKVPGRVLGVAPGNGLAANKPRAANLKQQQEQNEVKFKNCNLELSQREFDEVLAVLRARTPSGRRRAGLKTVKRRDRYEKSAEEGSVEGTKSRYSGNLESSECSTNNMVNGAKSCEGCNYKPWKKNDQAPEKTADFGHIYGNKNIYDPSRRGQEKLGQIGETDSIVLRAIKRNGSNTLVNEDADCPQNVSTKADILLGAILRTSRDRKGLSDVSNGTRPRSATSTAKFELEGNARKFRNLENADREGKVVPFEDEKSIPVALNKRFNQLRLLFKKEQEKKVTADGGGAPHDDTLVSNGHDSSVAYNNGGCCSGKGANGMMNNGAQQPGLHEPRATGRESRVKRRIDFSNFHEVPDKCPTEVSSKLSTNGAHQNSRSYSTNYEEDHRGDDAQAEDPAQDRRDGPPHSTKARCEPEEQKRAQTISHLNSRNDRTCAKNAGIPVASQNGYASSKIRNNNNNKEDALAEEDDSLDRTVPSAIEQERFRRSLENAASMVFHSRTGLPLTSSPAPLRRGSCCFDYDSSLNSVSSKRSALFELNTPPSPGAVSLEETDRETENAGEGEETTRRRSSSRSRPQSHSLLGSFEESALNGRLEPVSTVHGFTAELGASGSFCPKHRKLSVTVFFYTLGDNDKVSTPYLAHINLGKKGYQVPRSGTIQVTLLNPLGTVVKMFVVMYDLSDMPPRSHTFLRQRTLRDKTLRYLVHLRFMSGKSGRIYLHTDIRMIICRKSDVDTASDFGSEPPKELRSYIHGPTNPKFSPRC